MKIVISSQGNSMEDLLDVRFGRCNCFLIYNTKNEDTKFIENAGQSSEGGAGIAAAGQVIDQNVDIVITGNMGPNAFNLFKKAGIKVMRCSVMKLEDCIQMYKDGKLEELQNAGPAHKGMGGGFGYKGGN